MEKPRAVWQMEESIRRLGDAESRVHSTSFKGKSKW